MNNQELIEKLTINFIDSNGVVKVKELGKKVIGEPNAWVTVIFTGLNLENNETSVYLDRYQKSGGFYKRMSRFIVQNEAQAREIISFTAKSFGMIK